MHECPECRKDCDCAAGDEDYTECTHFEVCDVNESEDDDLADYDNAGLWDSPFSAGPDDDDE